MVKKLLILLITVLILGVGYYLLSPLFITIQADESAPLSSTQTETENKVAQITGTPAHKASGSVRIVRDETDTYIRYENFKTINGPDIYTYLTNDLDAKEYVSLGKVKATEGNINYKIPTGVNVADYKYVVVWCKAFGVLFNYADISGL